MALLAVGLVVFAAIGAASRGVERLPDRGDVRGLLFALVVGLAMLLWLGIAVLFDAIRCDETCEGGPAQPGESWRSFEDAWQWSGQLVVAALGSLCVVVALGLSVLDRHRQARASLVAAAFVYAAWGLLLLPAT